MPRLAALVFIVAVLAAACGPPGGPAAPAKQTAGASKRIVAAANHDPSVLVAKTTGRSSGGLWAVEQLVIVGLAITDPNDVLQPRLGEEVPSVENGLWRVLPDGRMVTTWNLRRNADWHDGTPFTSADLAFTFTVGQDRDLAILSHPGYASAEAVDTPDAHTVIIRWKRPYIDAPTLFNSLHSGYTAPLPRHLLERPYAEDRERFLDLPYWTEEFVGTGPYRLREWAVGSYAVFGANDRYVLGRPKIDEIEVRFITDPNTLVAGLLSGEIHVTLGSNVSLDQGLPIRERWQAGRVEFGYGSWMVIYPQFVTPNPPVIANLEFRRALLHAIDRQEMADTLQAGLVPAAHSYLAPNPIYRDIEGRYLVRYDYDPARARRMIEGVGYVRGPDGSFRDGPGQELRVEISTSTLNPINASAMSSIADYWRRIGLGVDEVVDSTGGVAYRERRANRPGFFNAQFSNDVRGLPNLRSSRAPLPENGYAGSNHSRYMSPEMDGLIDRFFGTIAAQERQEILGQVIRHISQQLPVMGLFYTVRPSMWINRLAHVTAKNDHSTTTWNVHEWELR